MSNEEKVRVSAEVARDTAEPVLPTVNPAVEKSQPEKETIHPAVYVVIWITLSSSVIVFNKWILDKKNFRFPIFLTTWHLIFATIMTQILARFTTLLDSRKKVPMTGRVYLRAIVPIGVFFSLSLICGNQTYLYLSVAFIQMLKATTPVAVLIATWSLRMAPVNLKTLGNVSFIVIGVIIASFGEIKFHMVGFLFQVAGVVFEAIRLVMVQGLLSSGDFKMDPLVSLYYYAPACAVMNSIVLLFTELPTLTVSDLYRVGLFTLFANACVAFLLNVSVVFLIGRTSSLVLTLCGVLKDILLVCLSMLLFKDPVSLLQAFGYSIALGGMLYYKLGADEIKRYLTEGRMKWAEFGSTQPVARKLTVFGVILFCIILFGTFGQSYSPVSSDQLHNGIGKLLGEKGE
ncbi:TPT-domain-containing protein [Delitschia confertaspora ATCC 74209]|uniref:TPT-domain-containing protein n=1 Tax=Delitschia confertaspora ATCC 74209 TaxID=1513339 RepID=A0A9P4MUQ9_9PLEO|nr:TPT-domain-containing protein [Delitschia confertaspora ATCC 74209]